MRTERELLLCPFCGQDAQINEVEPQGYVVECNEPTCNVSTPIVYALMDDVRPLLIERWNRRDGPLLYKAADK